MIMLEIVIGYYPNKPEYIQAILNQLVTTEKTSIPFIIRQNHCKTKKYSRSDVYHPRRTIHRQLIFQHPPSHHPMLSPKHT